MNCESFAGRREDTPCLAIIPMMIISLLNLLRGQLFWRGRVLQRCITRCGLVLMPTIQKRRMNRNRFRPSNACSKAIRWM